MLLRIVLRQPDSLRSWSEIELGVTSELTLLECFRVLDRLRLAGASAVEIAAKQRKVADLLSRMDIVRLDRSVLQRASSPLPVPLGALDSIHLASARTYRDAQRDDERPIQFATHDRQLSSAALELRFSILV